MVKELVVAAIDVGSALPPKGKTENRIGWAIDRPRRKGKDLDEFVATLSTVLKKKPIALGFEAPLFLPTRTDAKSLMGARTNEGGSAWSNRRGGGVAHAQAIVIAVYILRRLRSERSAIEAYLDWRKFRTDVLDRGGVGLYLWEAFVSGETKNRQSDEDPDVQDAIDAVTTFRLLEKTEFREGKYISAGTSDCFSSIGACLLHTGWSKSLRLLHTPTLAIKAPVRPVAAW